MKKLWLKIVHTHIIKHESKPVIINKNMLFFKTNLFIYFNQKCMFSIIFMINERSWNLSLINKFFYYVWGYVQTVPDDFESIKRLNLIFVSLLSGVHCIIITSYVIDSFILGLFIELRLSFELFLKTKK